MYVGICEDDLQSMLHLIQLIESQHCPVPIHIVQFATLQQLEQSKQIIDLLFLDIEVDSDNSIVFFSQSDKLATIPIIVLVSSHSYYVTNSFTVPVSQFLLKPIQPELFAKVFHNCCNRYMLLQQYCEVTTAQGMEQLLPLRTMVMIRSKQRLLHYTDSNDITYTGTESLKATYQRLKPFGFCQIHKSCLINMAFLVSLTEQEAIIKLQNKSTILPVGKKFSSTAKQQYLQYLAEKGEK